MRLERPVLRGDVEHQLRIYTTADGRALELFHVAAINPAVLAALRASTRAFLRDGSLDARAREVLVLRTTRRCHAEAEWAVHVDLFAEQARFSPGDLARLADVESSDYTGTDGTLIRLADELCTTQRITQELAQALAAEFSAAQIVEMVALVGQYRGVSLLITAFDIQVPVGLRGYEEC